MFVIVGDIASIGLLQLPVRNQLWNIRQLDPPVAFNCSNCFDSKSRGFETSKKTSFGSARMPQFYRCLSLQQHFGPLDCLTWQSAVPWLRSILVQRMTFLRCWSIVERVFDRLMTASSFFCSFDLLDLVFVALALIQKLRTVQSSNAFSNSTLGILTWN